jgi:hypothetical protein
VSRELRREGLRELMDRLANFAWYTGGSDNRVDHADPLGVADWPSLAWNPSLPGTKAEETFILTENGTEAITGS